MRADCAGIRVGQQDCRKGYHLASPISASSRAFSSSGARKYHTPRAGRENAGGGGFALDAIK
jgi:hypothetical protein